MEFLRANAAFLSAGFLLTFGSAFGQTFFISLFAGEIRADFGLSHGQWGSIYAVATGLSAIIMLWAGVLTDRMRVRVLAGLTLGVLAMASLLMSQAKAAWLLIPTILLLRFAGQGMMGHLASVAMARWFVAYRGKALGLASLGFSVAEASLPILVVFLMTILHWQTIWIGAACAALLYWPMIHRLLSLERTPQSVSDEIVSTGLGDRHWTRVEVLRHPLFWFLIPVLLGPPAFGTAFFFQQVPFADAKGWSHLQFVAMIPVYTLVAVAAMLASGILLDRVGTRRLMALYQAPMALGFVIFALTPSIPGLGLGFLFFAIGVGANMTIPAAFWAEFYGTRHLGAIRAMASAIMVLGSAIGPFLTGQGLSADIGIETQYLAIAGFFVFACVSAGIGLSRIDQRRLRS